MMATTRAQVPIDDFGQPGLDAVFYVGEGLGLASPSWYPVDRVEAHLAQSLLRDPHDLACHARRIDLWLDQPGFVELAAALTDLFLVLGTSNCKMQQRFLAMAGDRLPAEVREYLRAPIGATPVELPNSLFAYGPAYPGGPDFSARSAESFGNSEAKPFVIDDCSRPK